MADYGSGPKIYKMNLEHFVVPENNYMLKKMMRVCQNDLGVNPKKCPMSKAGTI